MYTIGVYFFSPRNRVISIYFLGLDLEALSGLGELARLGLAGSARSDRERLEQRLLDERIRLLTGPGKAFSDRERIERYLTK